MEPDSLSNIAQLLLREYAPVLGIPGAAALSLPTARNTPQGYLADALFFFNEESGQGRPFAWALFRASTGELISFSKCEYADFVPTRDYPLDMPVSLRSTRFLPPSQATEGRREMFNLYERLRSFLLSDSLSAEQLEMRGRYATLFEAYAYVDHRPFYKALAPEFIRWLGLGWDGPSSPERPAEHSVNPPAGEDGLAGAVKELRELFLDKIQTDAYKQQLFDEMHDELQQHKNNLLDAVTRSIEGDVIKAIEDIEKSMEIYRSRQFSQDNYRRLLTLFEGIKIDLADILYRNGVEPYSNDGNDVDISRQKIIATVPTEKKRLDKKVAIRHAQGWEKNGKVIRPERISVHLYQSPENAMDK